MAGQSAKGTTISIGGTAAGSVTDIQVSGLSRDTIDIRSHDSPDEAKEYVVGLVDGGEVTVEVNYSAGYKTIADLIYVNAATATPSAVVITHPLPGAWICSFDAWVTGTGSGAPYTDKDSGSFTLKITGKVNWT